MSKSEQTKKLEAAGLTILDDQADVQVVAESDLAETAASEAFMHEVLEIQLFPSTDPMAPPYAQLGVNGVRCVLPRAVPVRVQRKFVEVLARMKETRTTQDMTPNSQGEITMDTFRGHTGLVYPFTVLKDPNPKGAAWLANVLAERG